MLAAVAFGWLAAAPLAAERDRLGNILYTSSAADQSRTRSPVGFRVAIEGPTSNPVRR